MIEKLLAMSWVVAGAALAWAIALGVLIGSADYAAQRLGTELATGVITAAIALMSLFVFYFAGYTYVRFSGDRSILRAGLAGLLFVIAVFVLAMMMPDFDEPRPETHSWVELAPFALSFGLSTLGGWVAGRRRPAPPPRSADSADDNNDESKADSSLRSE